MNENTSKGRINPGSIIGAFGHLEPNRLRPTTGYWCLSTVTRGPTLTIVIATLLRYTTPYTHCQALYG